jgi:hypothetical protein
MTLPWHWLGLNGQWRRVAHFDYSDPLIAWWGPWVVVIPLVQGAAGGVGAYIAICRAIGILPGSPARPTPPSEAAPFPVTQVSWSDQTISVTRWKGTRPIR